MIKSELLLAINKKFPDLAPADVELAVNCMLNQMCHTLAQGGRIEIRGFGRFALRHRPPRLARNPKTGESVKLPARVSIHFKPGKEMSQRVDAMRNQCPIID